MTVPYTAAKKADEKKATAAVSAASAAVAGIGRGRGTGRAPGGRLGGRGGARRAGMPVGQTRGGSRAPRTRATPRTRTKTPSSVSGLPVPPPSKCAPSRYAHSTRAGTCLTPDDVRVVALALGVPAGSDEGAASDPEAAAPATLRRLHARLGTLPGQEVSWTALPEVAASPSAAAVLDRVFRPAPPAAWRENPYAWLSNIDIDRVMRQYHGLRGFRFVGVFARDAEARETPDSPCVSEDLCRLHVADVVASSASSASSASGRVTQLGMVFNMDKHTGRGSHWTACYVGLDPARPHRFGAFYYDSVGIQPPLEIRAFVRRIAAEAGAAFGGVPPFVTAHNTVRKQFRDTECGVYAMLFLVACVEIEMPFGDICTHLIKRDGDMHALRSIFFREPAAARG